MTTTACVDDEPASGDAEVIEFAKQYVERLTKGVCGKHGKPKTRCFGGRVGPMGDHVIITDGRVTSNGKELVLEGPDYFAIKLDLTRMYHTVSALSGEHLLVSEHGGPYMALNA